MVVEAVYARKTSLNSGVLHVSACIHVCVTCCVRVCDREMTLYVLHIPLPFWLFPVYMLQSQAPKPSYVASVNEVKCWSIHVYVLCLQYFIGEDIYMHIVHVYCISSKSRHPRNVTSYFSQLIPISTALKVSPHGTDRQQYNVYAHALL